MILIYTLSMMSRNFKSGCYKRKEQRKRLEVNALENIVLFLIVLRLSFGEGAQNLCHVPGRR